jgi:uncharacterized protein YegP (UPF0339 family)
MRKAIVSSLFVVAALLVYQGTPEPSALAQKDKKEVKDKKEIKKTTSAAGVIEIGEGKDGRFRFFVRDSDGKLLAMSGPTGFAEASDAEKAIESLREVVAKAKVVMKKSAK